MSSAPLMRLAAGALVVTSLLALSGCATLSEDAGIGDVQARIDTRLEAGEKQPLQWLQTAEARQQAAAEVDRLLASGPLSADAAVRIALLNNPELQMRLAELGIADSDRVQAGRLRNPGFSYGRLKRGDEIEIERTFLFDIFGLLTIPARTAIEERRVEETQLRVAGEVMRIAHDTRKAWIDAVAARQAETYWLQVREAAEASATLGRRMAEVGHWGVREQAREQGFYADATARLAMARQQSVETREALIRRSACGAGRPASRCPNACRICPAPPAPMRTSSSRPSATAWTCNWRGGKPRDWRSRPA